jgi:hypothetical protein
MTANAGSRVWGVWSRRPRLELSRNQQRIAIGVSHRAFVIGDFNAA